MPGESQLVRDLLRPTAYPQPRPRQVELASTHISWVFLTDDDAWKVKRPVTLAFLDYGTAEMRRLCCEEEVRLNRRLAPDVYLGVVPIRLGAAGHVVDAAQAAGPIVDHAVRMRRLADAHSALALVRRNELSTDHLARLAARLGRFYVEAREAPEWGGQDVIATLVEQNLEQLRPFAGREFGRERFEQVAAAQRHDLRRFERRFGERRQAGRMREGHGDLRLEHIYFPSLSPVDPVVIDAVEFSERLRSGDVALDIAFVAMELDAERRPDLAEYFLYRFARESNDYDFYPLLDFYICYRALVRTKVACLLAEDPTTPPEKARRKQDEAARLLELAFVHAVPKERSTRPAVIAVGGVTGTGKSTLAEALARGLGLPVVSSDRVRKYLADIPAMERGPEQIYSPAHTGRTYEELLRRAEIVLQSGRGVILDATFSDRRWRERVRELATTHRAPFLFVEATCDETTLRDRVRARATGPSESDADLRVLDQMHATFDKVDELSPPEYLLAEASRDEAALVADVKHRLV